MRVDGLPQPDVALAACATAGWDTSPRPESWKSEPGCFAWTGLRNPHAVVLYIDGVEVGVVAEREVDGAPVIGMVVMLRFHPVLTPAECSALMATIARPATDGLVLAACAAAGWDISPRPASWQNPVGCFAWPSPTGGRAIDLYVDGALVGHVFPDDSKQGVWMWSKYTLQRSVWSPEECRRRVTAHPDGDPAFVRRSRRNAILLAFPGRWEGWLVRVLVRILPAHWGLALAVARGGTPEQRA